MNAMGKLFAFAVAAPPIVFSYLHFKVDLAKLDDAQTRKFICSLPTDCGDMRKPVDTRAEREALQAEVDKLEDEKKIAELKAKRDQLLREQEQRLAEAAARKDDERREALRREAERKDAERRQIEQRAAEEREAERREAEARRLAQREADRLDNERREAEQREAEQREAEREDAQRKEAERREAILSHCDTVSASFWDTDRPPTIPGNLRSEMSVPDRSVIRSCEAAAETGDRRYYFQIGRIYDHLQEYERALQYYRYASAQGSIAALINLGAMYADGRGVAKDEAEATRLLSRAAMAGHPFGMYAYASVLERIGTPEALEAAELWHRRAIADGLAYPKLAIEALSRLRQQCEQERRPSW